MALADAYSAGEMWAVCYECCSFMRLGCSPMKLTPLAQKKLDLFSSRHRPCERKWSYAGRDDCISWDSDFCLGHVVDAKFDEEKLTPMEQLALLGGVG